MKSTFILAGQSNISGRGGLSRYNDKWVWDENTDQIAHMLQIESKDPRIRRLSAEDTWEVAHEPLHGDIDTLKTCGIGPGLLFSKMLIRDIDQLVDLVPCAVGGTCIREWNPQFNLFKHMVERSKFAGNTTALIWYQGESDAGPDFPSDYAVQLKQMLDTFRTEVGNMNVPVVVIIPVGVLQTLPNISSVRESVQRVAESDSNCIPVDIWSFVLDQTSEIPQIYNPLPGQGDEIVNLLRSDHVHLSFHAQYLLATQIFKLWKEKSAK